MNKVKRTFILGEEWLYYKIYTGPKSADIILAEIVKPVTDILLQNNIIDKWFFIRFSDPDLHIRLRFHIKEPDNILEVIDRMKEKLEPFIEQNLVWKLQTDTYQRELERYNEDLIELAETLFYFDSKLIVNIVDLIEGDEGEIIRWRFSLRNIDQLLNDFGYSIEQKLNLLDSLKTGFANEFNMNKQLKLQLDKKFRNERDEINIVLNRKLDAANEMLPLFELVNIRSKVNITITHKIKENTTNHDELNNLMSSYIHMTMNRLFKSKQRIHEMVVYDFLFRYYKSEIAKQKYKTK